jgi:hypothetical protein
VVEIIGPFACVPESHADLTVTRLGLSHCLHFIVIEIRFDYNLPPSAAVGLEIVLDVITIRHEGGE